MCLCRAQEKPPSELRADCEACVSTLHDVLSDKKLEMTAPFCRSVGECFRQVNKQRSIASRLPSMCRVCARCVCVYCAARGFHHRVVLPLQWWSEFLAPRTGVTRVVSWWEVRRAIYGAVQQEPPEPVRETGALGSVVSSLDVVRPSLTTVRPDFFQLLRNIKGNMCDMEYCSMLKL